MTAFETAEGKARRLAGQPPPPTPDDGQDEREGDVEAVEGGEPSEPKSAEEVAVEKAPKGTAKAAPKKPAPPPE